jgi:hypothetical protein
LIDCNREDIGWVNEIFFFISEDKARPEGFELPDEFVTAELKGGLGNQMFQVASAYAYAQTHGKTLIFDHTPRIISALADKPRPSYFENTFHWTTADKKERYWNKYDEKDFEFSDIPAYHGNVKLHGYFQSPQYFDTYRSSLIKYFTEKKVVGIPVRAEDGPIVSVHFRRSDYVGHSLHANQPDSYYTDAVKALQAQTGVPGLQLVIFSDDIPWCQAHLPTLFSEPVSLYFVEEGFTDEQEMVLMSKCDHHIIAN